jgi:hypothetical protein
VDEVVKGPDASTCSENAAVSPTKRLKVIAKTGPTLDTNLKGVAPVALRLTDDEATLGHHREPHLGGGDGNVGQAVGGDRPA